MHRQAYIIMLFREFETDISYRTRLLGYISYTMGAQNNDY